MQFEHLIRRSVSCYPGCARTARSGRRRGKRELAAALASGDNAATTEALTAMDEASAALNQDDKTWRQVQKLVELRRKLAQSQSRREAWLGQNMTLAQAHALGCAVFDAIKRRVLDPAERLAIMDDVGRLMGYGPFARSPLMLTAEGPEAANQ